uniref:Uncharacterized protein n=1 Tax=Arundo donax TaxID=35708 RepID=A0A0A8YNA5_ARUDO
MFVTLLGLLATKFCLVMFTSLVGYKVLSDDVYYFSWLYLL